MAAASSSDSSADLETDELLRSSELFTNVEWNLSRVLKGLKKKIFKNERSVAGRGFESEHGAGVLLFYNTGHAFYASVLLFCTE